MKYVQSLKGVQRLQSNFNIVFYLEQILMCFDCELEQLNTIQFD